MGSVTTPCLPFSWDWVSVPLLFRELAVSHLLMTFVAVIGMVGLISEWFIKDLAILFK